MAKEEKNFTVMITDTDIAGTPDTVTYKGRVVESTDETLGKNATGELESPDFTKTGSQLYADALAQFKTENGIS